MGNFYFYRGYSIVCIYYFGSTWLVFVMENLSDIVDTICFQTGCAPAEACEAITYTDGGIIAAIMRILPDDY